MRDYKRIFIAKLEYEQDIASSEDRRLIINTFKNLIKFSDSLIFNQQIERNIRYHVNYLNTIVGIHKEYRQNDVFGKPEIDLMFWNLISVNFINRIFSNVIQFIYEELPSKSGDLETIIENYLHWDN